MSENGAGRPYGSPPFAKGRVLRISPQRRRERRALPCLQKTLSASGALCGAKGFFSTLRGGVGGIHPEGQ